uniref:Reverse transcriptase domain-containing protein n=1 Tax=Heterorhabditis bacteriophora TaxID=37862 RepID=A0A1I7WG65_HETBA
MLHVTCYCYQWTENNYYSGPYLSVIQSYLYICGDDVIENLQSRPDIIGAFDSFLLDDPTDYQFTELLEELDRRIGSIQGPKGVSISFSFFLPNSSDRMLRNNCHPK